MLLMICYNFKVAFYKVFACGHSHSIHKPFFIPNLLLHLIWFVVSVYQDQLMAVDLPLNSSIICSNFAVKEQIMTTKVEMLNALWSEIGTLEELLYVRLGMLKIEWRRTENFRNILVIEDPKIWVVIEWIFGWFCDGAGILTVLKLRLSEGHVAFKIALLQATGNRTKL